MAARPLARRAFFDFTCSSYRSCPAQLGDRPGLRLRPGRGADLVCCIDEMDSSCDLIGIDAPKLRIPLIVITGPGIVITDSADRDHAVGAKRR
jgi:hypothetical protein